VLLGAAAYYLTYLLFRNFQGFQWIMLRSAFFCGIYFTGMTLMKLTPDVQPVLATLKKKLRPGN
jgi:hypothetical protein